MPGWRILLWALLVIAGVVFIYLVRGILLPFIVSLIIAAMLEPTVRRLRLRGMSRGGAVWLVVGVFYVAMVVLGVLVTPRITTETQSLTEQVQELTTSFYRQSENDNFFVRWNPVLQVQQQGGAVDKFDTILARYGGTLARLGLPSTRREIMEQYVDKNRPQITKTVQNFSNAAFGFLTDLFSHLMLIVIVPILVPMILLDLDNIRRRGP